MRKININPSSVSEFLNSNSDKSIQEIYDFIKKKKLKNRSNEEIVVFTYIYTNRRKLGVKK